MDKVVERDNLVGDNLEKIHSFSHLNPNTADLNDAVAVLKRKPIKEPFPNASSPS